ncbi:ATPase WRNIP1-like [Aphidius gifuensis]|uniref:ATPase WRNIP1-like n=1 Tax=Aphidius gifuensis TaxID=684658 RepID=UPI001CDD00BC|nr:ATPase WRNIP1-like [Aphidius gifuensis]
MECPICQCFFLKSIIENHVNDCLNLSKKNDTMSFKRIFPFEKNTEDNNSHLIKKTKIDNNNNIISLAQKLQPNCLEDYFGQKHIVGKSTVFGKLFNKNELISMIFWGPPGCGKTTLVNIICKKFNINKKCQTKLLKLSATSSKIGDIKIAVGAAENDKKHGHKTVIFMNDIHRFNKLQQDIFLPHIESGTFILIGATTENPFYSLNSALLSRCRVFSFEKLKSQDIKLILLKAIGLLNGKIQSTNNSLNENVNCHVDEKFKINTETLDWLIDTCDGNATIAIKSLEKTVKSINNNKGSSALLMTIDDIKINMEKVDEFSDNNKCDMNVYLIMALHRCIKDGHENGALYWLARLFNAKEDPVFIAKRLINIASKEICLDDDPEAQSLAVSTMYGCQMIGMPECDVLLAQCVLYLCRASKIPYHHQINS